MVSGAGFTAMVYVPAAITASGRRAARGAGPRAAFGRLTASLDTGWESASANVKVKLPVCVGVPLISPDGARESPGGGLPEVMLHVYGGIPPAAVNRKLYGVPMVAAGSGGLVTTDSAGRIVTENAPLRLGAGPSKTPPEVTV